MLWSQSPGITVIKLFKKFIKKKSWLLQNTKANNSLNFHFLYLSKSKPNTFQVNRTYVCWCICWIQKRIWIRSRNSELWLPGAERNVYTSATLIE